MGGYCVGNIVSEMIVIDLGSDWVEIDFFELLEICDWMFVFIEIENCKIYELG